MTNILIALAAFFAGYLFSNYRANRIPRILKLHDPSKPFTTAELRACHIIPPEKYDEWVKEFARR